MIKRKSEDIERDYQRIRKCINSTCVTSLKQVALALDLSEAEVRTSLSKHPTVFKRIMDELSSNRVKKKEERRVAIETVKTEETEETVDSEVKIVIDASITGFPFLRKRISEAKKIIVTSVALKELNEMQKFNDLQGTDAKFLMASAAEEPEKFELIPIEEATSADDSIIHYCASNKDSTVLWTSDKNMLLTARMLGVKTEYFKQEKPVIKNSITTLLFAKKIGNKLFISNFNSERKSIMLISNSNGETYTDGIHEISIGDDIYLSTQKEDYITFAHYHVISLGVTDNSRLVFSKRIHYSCEIDLLPDNYVAFVKSFKARLTW